MAASLIGALIAPAATLASGTAPTTGADNYTVLEDSGLNSFNLLSNDEDADHDPLSVTGFGNWTAAWGAKTWAADGEFTYTPTADYCKTSGTNNTYAFVYDGSNSVMGYIHIAVTCVNDEPAFTPGADVTVNEDSGAYSAAWATGIGVGGGADEVAQTVTFHVSNDNNSLFSTQPAISSGGTLSFTPGANKHGSALVSVYLTDSGSNVDPNDNVTATVQFTINVTSDPDAPVATDDEATIAEDADATAIDVLANDIDGDGDVLEITDATTPANGTVVIDGDGYGLTYQPDADYCGSDTFDYTITDGTTSDSATVSVTVTCVNDDPVAQDDTVGSGTEDQGTGISIDPADLLANDSDTETAHDALAIDFWGDPAVGGTVSWNVDTGMLVFELTPDFCGTASFTYEVVDTDGGVATAVDSIDVTCVNDNPVATDQDVNADENKTENITLSGTDVDEDALTFSITVGPAHGDLSCDADGACTYTPDSGYYGADEFSFLVNDGTVNSASEGVVSITVAKDAVGPVAVAPTAAFGTGRVDETAPIRLSWSANDNATGVASYEVQVKVATGSWTAVYTGTATAVTKFYPFAKALVWRVRATDGEGNVGDWATNVTARTIVTYQGGSPVTYTGTWGTYPSAGSSGTGYRYTLSAGKTAVLRFTGLQVLYVAPKTAGSGSVIVYVDNVKLGTFSLRTASTTLGQIIARKTWGTSGTHTIKIVSVTAGRQTNLDAFVVLK